MTRRRYELSAWAAKVVTRTGVPGLCLVALGLSACSQEPADAVADQWSLVSEYCTECHNDDDLSGGMSLVRLSPTHVAEHPEVWEKVVRKLRGSLMPPPGGPRPSVESTDAFVAALEDYLDAAAAARGPAPGRVVAHRLNRTEYANAVESLLGVRIDAASMLPADVSSEGFDNVADVLRVSPTHLDQYIHAAREISRVAVGNPFAQPTRSEYRPQLEDWTKHVDGLPLGTRGGFQFEHFFPADGEYVFDLEVAAKTYEAATDLRAYPHGWLEYRHRVILTIDGEKVFEGELGGEEDLRAMDQQQISAVQAIKDRFRAIRLSVKAGTHRIGATFVARSFAESDHRLASIVPGEGVPDVPRMRWLVVVGPYHPTGFHEPTRSRQTIFSCYPEAQEQEQACATQILTDLARRAFRRPVGAADLDPLLDFYRAGHDSSGFEGGIQQGIMAILASTKFLYRVEADGTPANVTPGTAYAIDDFELASRLAFFLWSQGPDKELLDLAEQGRLADSNVYEQQVRRLFADPRAESLITNFAFQWLDVRRLEGVEPDPKLYSAFDEDLRTAFREEMRLFLDSILRDPDASVLDVLTAEHTFVNERLARHYGIDVVRGDQYRRVELDDPRRFGLFGKGSVLMATSYPDRTSPVLRGAWILERVLGTPPAPVPAGVETNLDQRPEDAPRSVRDRLALHRTQPSCNSCHAVIDPLGQALENFGPIGEWRDREIDSGVAIDSRGELLDGTPVASPMDLRAALTAKPDQFAQAVTEKLLIYALGRGIEHEDMPVVRAIVAQAADTDYSFLSIVMGVAQSAPFRMRALVDSANEHETLAARAQPAAGGN